MSDSTKQPTDGTMGDNDPSVDNTSLMSDSVKEEERDLSSHPENKESLSVQAALSAFRVEWHKELSNETKANDKFDDDDNKVLEVNKLSVAETDPEALAKSLFLQGVENEQKGQLYDAIRFYKKAEQLVPDIELKLYRAERQEPNSNDIVRDNSDTVDSDGDGDLSEDSQMELLPRLHKWLARSPLCTPAQQQRAPHISSLPMEILIYILRWVVSYDLDVRSLEMFGLVSRGFFICSRDPEIWRLICQRLWGANCGGLSNHITWREMYLKRPHLYFSGCYINKTTYVRHGENSFQDQFYRPWHLVEYFRYLRFFPEGKVLMLTTAESPVPVLGSLRHRYSKNPAVLTGHYRVIDDRICVTLQKNEKSSGNDNRYGRNRRQNVELIEQTFRIELEVKPWKSQSNRQLVWKHYSVLCKMGVTATLTNFDVMSNKFPPFWFSRVKSYNAESEKPLM